ncbi:MAG: hypothetical protein JO323_15590 [Acidobacteriia bacterium]|nr:hypothetical protein [Terriglobia bacterium]
MKCTFPIALASLVLAAAPAFAHHSFASEFDDKKPVSLTGTVTKVDWMNPHIWLYVDVKDESGKMEHWQCEGGAPNGLTRQGWSRSSLKAGDEVIIDGFRAKDATTTCNARSVKLPDGRRVFAGSPDDNGPNAKGKQ